MTTPSFTFTLTPDPSAPIASSTSPTTPKAVTPRPTVKRGLRRPFQRDGKGGFARIDGDDLLEEKLGNLLGLSGLPWDPARTSRLDELRHLAGSSAFRAFARAYVADALRTYLPELQLVEVQTEGSGAAQKIVVVASKVARPDSLVRTELSFAR